MNSRKKTIGLICPDLSDIYQREIWKGVIHETQNNDLRLLTFAGGILDHHEMIIKNRTPLYKLINSANVDALLIITGAIITYCGLPGIQKLIKNYQNIPIVSLSIPIPGVPGIIVDNSSGMYELVSHLINEHKCKRIAFIKGPEKNDEAIQRFEAYKQCLKDHKIKLYSELLCEGNFEPSDGVNGVNTLIDERKVKFDALICVDDYAALSAIETLKKKGYRIPDDIKVCGFDDIYKSKYSTPGLSTVRQPLYEMGAIAVNTAIDLMNNREVENITKVKTQVVIRESCGCNIFKNKSKLKIKHNKNNVHKLFYNILDIVKHSINNQLHLYNANETHDFLDKKILELIITTFNALNSKNNDMLFNSIKEIISDSFYKGYNSELWSEILSIIFYNIDIAFQDKELIVDIDKLLYKSLVVLNKTEIKLLNYKEITTADISYRLQRTGDALLTSLDINQIKNILTKYLPFLQINNCIVSLYTDKTKEYSKIFHYIGDMELKNISKKKFKSINLYPDNLISANDKSYVVLHLSVETDQFGYILIELSDVDDKAYEYLAEKVSRALKSAYLALQIKEHTKELEREVAEQTVELRLANEQLKELSYRDQLSGLRNRRFLMDIVVPETKTLFTAAALSNKFKNKRKFIKNTSYAIFLIDLDYFKDVNDTYGHEAGDKILIQLSRIFKDIIREDDYVIRYGGEEFLIIFKNFNPDNLNLKAEEIRKTIENYSFDAAPNIVLKKTCSIGCTCFPVNNNYPDKIDFIQAINLSDLALYHAKNNGRNKGIRFILNDVFFEKKQDVTVLQSATEWAEHKKYIEFVNTKTE